MKKLFSLALVLCMLLAFTGCSGASIDDYVGTWTVPVDFTDYMVKSMGEDETGLLDSCDFHDLTMTFALDINADKTGRIYIDEASVNSMLDKMKTQIKDGVVDMMTQQLDQLAQENGTTLEALLELMGVEDVEQAFTQFSGMGSMDEILDASLAEVDVQGMMKEAETSGTVSVSGNTLTLKGNSTEDKLTYDSKTGVLHCDVVLADLGINGLNFTKK